MSTFTYVLYCVHSNSRGCENALSIIQENLQLKNIVHIQDVKTIEKPAWLKGVPVLAKVSTKEIWEGTSAIEQLNYLSGYYSGQPWEKYTSNLAIRPSVPLLQTVANMSTESSKQSANQVFPSGMQSVPQSFQPTIQLLSSPQQPQNQLLQQASAAQSLQPQQTEVVPQSKLSQQQPLPPTPTPSLPPTSPLPPTPSPKSPPTLTTPQINLPAGDRLNTRLQNDKSPADKSKVKDPNRLQPMPLPDDPQKSKELVLPPLPVFPKKEMIVTPQMSTSQIKSIPSTPMIQDDVPPETKIQSRSTPGKHDGDNNDDDGDDGNDGDNNNRAIHNHVKIDNRRLEPVHNQEDSNESNYFKSEDLQQNHEMVFSSSELQEIENVMAKPKTVNKRQPQRNRGRSQQQSRTIAQNARKTQNTIVIKEDQVDDSAEDE